MKIAAVCITYGRPRQLGRLIECFQRQTYEDRELLILDDGGQYPSQPSGDRWRVVSHRSRYGSLGEKRHAAASMVQADAMAIWDDDDIYLPWALAAASRGLEKTRWVQGREAFEWDGQTMTRIETFHRSEPHLCAHHGGWAYRMEAYHAAGGYVGHDEDNGLMRRMITAAGYAGDTICEAFPEPGYVYSRENDVSHISRDYGLGDFAGAWERMAKPLTSAHLVVGWDRDYLAVPRPAVATPRQW